jgi:methylmalonyl-CoA/ethylmalonyl-CoA epimerase
MKPSIAHIGVAVPDVEAAMQFYRDVLDVPCRGPEEADGARIVHLQFDGAEVELLEPLRDDTPIARFLAKRGPGIHHICYRVADLEAALIVCRQRGYQLVDDLPRTGAGGHRIAFLHPKSTSGILVELTE